MVCNNSHFIPATRGNVTAVMRANFAFNTTGRMFNARGGIRPTANIPPIVMVLTADMEED